MISKFIVFVRKVIWKLRWRLNKKPFVIRNWHNGYSITTPLSGSAAQIYYRGYSMPEVAKWMQENIKEGDCFIDVGAHIGEYALIAAASVAECGQIIAVEPQEDLCAFIQENFRKNNIAHGEVIHAAVGATEGKCKLAADPENKGAVLNQESDGQEVAMVSLATVLGRATGEGNVWIKLDAAGFEIAALDACWDLLGANRVRLMLKAYSHDEIIRRFPQLDGNLYERLSLHGYKCRVFSGGGLVSWTGEENGYCQMVLCEPAQM